LDALPFSPLRGPPRRRDFGEISESLSYMEKSLASNPNDPELWLERADIMDGCGKLEEALASVEEAARKGASRRDCHIAKGDILLVSGRFIEALEEFEAGLSEVPNDWELLGDREVARACLGQHGPLMEALPAALNRANIPTELNPLVCEFVFNVALRCAQRGEADNCFGLFNATLAMTEWRKSDRFGQESGRFLRRVLDIQPEIFTELVQSMTSKITDQNLLKLLDPFIKAAEFIQKKDVVLLEKLFPEIRELVLDIVKRADPEFYNKIGKAVTSS